MRKNYGRNVFLRDIFIRIMTSLGKSTVNSSVFLLENVAIEYVNTPKYTLFSADFYFKVTEKSS